MFFQQHSNQARALPTNHQPTQGQRALEVAFAISRIFRQVGQEETFDYSITVESCRGTLNSLQRNQTFAHTEAAKMWLTACFDMLKSIQELLNKWQDHGKLDLYLADARQKKKLDRMFAQLGLHVDSIRQLTRRNAMLNGTTLEENELLTNISHMIDDVQGREWWINNFGKSKYMVAWREFVERLCGTEAVQDLLQEEQTIQHLKESLDFSNSEMVTAHKWGQFLNGFGPGIPGSIQQMKGALSESWFAGFVAYDEARDMLRTCSPGAFLVRFSRTLPCGFAVAFVDPSTGKVTQSLIKARASGGASGEGGFEMDGTVYPSLKDLVDSNAETLQFPAPTIKIFARARYFKGHITFEDACAMLNQKPPGTFLLRFSRNSRAALVVAFVNSENQVVQSLIYSEPDNGGYRLGSRVYSTLDNLVQQNSKKLKFPLDPDDENSSETFVTNMVHSGTDTQKEQSLYGSVHPNFDVTTPSATLGQMQAVTNTHDFVDDGHYGPIPGEASFSEQSETSPTTATTAATNLPEGGQPEGAADLFDLEQNYMPIPVKDSEE